MGQWSSGYDPARIAQNSDGVLDGIFDELFSPSFFLFIFLDSDV